MVNFLPISGCGVRLSRYGSARKWALYQSPHGHIQVVAQMNNQYLHSPTQFILTISEKDEVKVVGKWYRETRGPGELRPLTLSEQEQALCLGMMV